MEDKDADYIDLQDDNHGHGYRLPKIEDHVGEELQSVPCETEVTQEHVRQLRQMIVLQQHALAVVQRFMFDALPSGDARVEELNDYLNVELPWIK